MNISIIFFLHNFGTTIITQRGGSERTVVSSKNGLILPTGQWYAPSAVINDAGYCMVLHGIAWYCIVLHGISWYCLILHGIAWYAMVLQDIAWYCMVLHGIA